MLYLIAIMSTPVLPLSEDDVVAWLVERARVAGGPDADLGTLELAVEAASRSCRQRALATLTQERAAAQPLVCPQCAGRLLVEAYGRARQVQSSFGPIAFRRDYGFCSPCGQHVYPADVALGLHPRATGSPRVQERCALYALRGPTAQGADDFRRLTGLPLDPSTVHREARRQGERARALRERDMALTQTPEGIAQLAQSAAVGTKNQTLVIEIDAWNIRERDDWGQSAQLRRRGQEPNRWHWVLTGTIFRLDHRGKTHAGRPFITERGFVATRQGLDAFRQQLYAEALRRGLSQARDVLVVADGAVWIWNLVDDRFPGARQRVDLYHVKEHLWALAHEVFGQGTEEAHAWVRPLIRMLEQRTDGALDVIHGLKGLLTTLEQLTTEQRAAVEREIGYFNQHKRRMDYKQAARLGQPLGSGAIESTCSQYQRRLKLTGQFWSLTGDEAFLSLLTLHRNGRWHLLFPHDHADS
jgi:hypothetical protein